MKTNIRNVQDVKNYEGMWLKSFYIDGDQHHTRSGILWASLVARTNLSAFGETKWPTYSNCKNGFSSFQEFAEWCQQEYGYLNKENDRFWCLDKDIILPLNRIYCGTTCLFIPNRINQLLKESSKNSNMPIGVCKRKYSYEASIFKSDEGQTSLGHFKTKEEAHQAWQQSKVEHIRQICNTDVDVIKHKKLKNALTHRADLIENELLLNVETKFK